MKSHDLAKILLDQPDKEVRIFWDGAARGEVDGIVVDEVKVVIVGEWCIYRDGNYRAYPEHQIVYSKEQ